jgi:hypothetical protein
MEDEPTPQEQPSEWVQTVTCQTVDYAYKNSVEVVDVWRNDEQVLFGGGLVLQRNIPKSGTVELSGAIRRGDLEHLRFNSLAEVTGTMHALHELQKRWAEVLGDAIAAEREKAATS